MRLPSLDEESMKRIERAELLGLAFNTVTDTAVARCLEFCRAHRASYTVITPIFPACA
jgi:hypothetical protein